MISRKSLLLKSVHVSARLTHKSGSQAPMSAYASTRRQQEMKDRANGNFHSVMNLALKGQYISAVGLGSEITDRRGYIRKRKQFVATRTASLPADLLSDKTDGSGALGIGMVGGKHERSAITGADGKGGPNFRQLTRRAFNPSAAAAEAAKDLAKEYTETFRAPWLSLFRQRAKYMGTRGRAATLVRSSAMYTQSGLEMHFGDDPIDRIAKRINNEVLSELHAKTPHPIHFLGGGESAASSSVPFESVKKMTMAPVLFAPKQNSEKEKRIAMQQAGGVSVNTPSPSSAYTAPAGTINASSHFRNNRLLKIPSWPLAALLLDNKPSNNKCYLSMPQWWHNVTTGDKGSAAAHKKSNDDNSGGGSSAPSTTLMNLPPAAEVTARALKYTETVDRAAILGQSPGSTLYQLQVLASLGVPLVGLDELIIAAALDHWHSYGLHEQQQGPCEQLVVLRSVVHLAMARVAAESGLVETNADSQRTINKNNRNAAAEEDEDESNESPVGNDDSIAAVSQFLLRTNPTFPTKLAQSAPEMFAYFSSRGLLLDYLELQWHWTLWMGGGLPDPTVIEAGGEGLISGSSAATSKKEHSGEDGDEAAGAGGAQKSTPNTISSNTGSSTGESSDYWSRFSESSHSRVDDLVGNRRTSILSLYPNTVTDNCARSAAFSYWRHTCGLTGPNLIAIARNGGCDVSTMSDNTDGDVDGGLVPVSNALSNAPPSSSSWFKPVYSGHNNAVMNKKVEKHVPSFKKAGNAATVAGCSSKKSKTATGSGNASVSGDGHNNEAAIVASTTTITGDRPILHSLTIPLTIVTEVLRGLWDRNTSASSPPVVIPFHRRVAVVEWAADILRAIAAIHRRALTVGVPTTAAGGGGGGAATTNLPSRPHLRTAVVTKDDVMLATSDLSARLAAAMGELMDTIVDVCGTVSASGKLKGGADKDDAHTAPSSLSSSMPSASSNTATVAIPISSSNPSDSLEQLKSNLLGSALPALILETSALFTVCCEQLLDYPVMVNPFVHVSVVDAVRAHQELVDCDFVVNGSRDQNETKKSARAAVAALLKQTLAQHGEVTSELSGDPDAPEGGENEDDGNSETDDAYSDRFNADGSVKDGRVRTSMV